MILIGYHNLTGTLTHLWKIISCCNPDNWGQITRKTETKGFAGLKNKWLTLRRILLKWQLHLNPAWCISPITCLKTTWYKCYTMVWKTNMERLFKLQTQKTAVRICQLNDKLFRLLWGPAPWRRKIIITIITKLYLENICQTESWKKGPKLCYFINLPSGVTITCVVPA